MKSAIDWLLEGDQPSIKYLTLSRLQDRKETDPEVKSAKSSITVRGWVSDILAKRETGGYWVSSKSLYTPKYLSTNWMLLVLSDLGVTRSDPSYCRVRRALDQDLLKA